MATVNVNLAQLLVIGFALLHTGCDASEAAGRTRVGVLLPMTATGPAAQMAEQLLSGLRAGMAEASDQIAIGDIQLRDNALDPIRTVEAILEFAKDPSIALIIGPFASNCCLAAAPRAEALQIPMITPFGTDDAITAGRSWVFRTCFTNAEQGARMAKFGRQQLGLERAAILKDITKDYSLGLAESFAAEFLRQGGTVCAEHWYRGENLAEDADRVAAWIDRVDCDVIYLPGYSDDVQTILDRNTQRLIERKLTLLGGDGWGAASTGREVADWPTRLYHTTHFAADSAAEPTRRFLAEHGNDNTTTPSPDLALGYDTGVLVARVLAQAAGNATTKTKRAAIREATAATLPTFTGVTGAFRVDPSTQDLRKDVAVMHWTGERWQVVAR